MAFVRLPSAFASLVLSSLALSAGCSSGDGDDAPLVIAEGCQPLFGGATCLAPYPSDFFRVPDGATLTGSKLALADAAKPKTVNGIDGDMTAFRTYDGFSLQPTLVAAFPGKVAADGLPPLVGEGAGATSPTAGTVLLDAATGALVPHYTDVNPDEGDGSVTPFGTPVVLRPLVQLTPRTRYVVAIQGAKRPTGEAVPPAEGFRRLRDKVTGTPALDALAPRYETDVFAPLVRAGVAREGLQLAWDFTTGSAEEPKVDLLEVRAQTLAWLAASTPKVTVTAVKDMSAPAWKRIEGTIEGPRFVDRETGGAKLLRDAAGKVRQDGTIAFPFVATIPIAVRDQFGPGLALDLGHGFFGAKEEAVGGLSTKLTGHVGAVAFAVDWQGMSQEDMFNVAELINGRTGALAELTERVHQAVANWLTLTVAIKKVFPTLPELKRPATGPGTSTDGSGQSNAGQPYFDPAHVHYFGASQGHILGATMAAMNPELEHVVLNVGGAALTHMMPRARPFQGLFFFVRQNYKDPLDQELFIALSARGLDTIDPATYTRELFAAPLPGTTPERRVLMQVGLGDSEVPNLGTLFHARTLGLPVTGTDAANLFGLVAGGDGPLPNGFTFLDYGVDPLANASPKPIVKNGIHEAARNELPFMDEMKRFYREGVVVHPCSGRCRATPPTL